MIRALLRLARAFTGLWSEIRSLRRLVEWLFINGISGRFDPASGQFVVFPLNLPPTKGQIADALKETVEFTTVPDEEQLAAERAIDLLRRRANGEIIPEDEPGADFKLF